MAAALLAAPVARAADPNFCRDYARVAVDQVKTIRYNMPWCSPGAQGSRWIMDYREHFNWCLGAPYRAAQDERAARHDYIEGCRRH